MSIAEIKRKARAFLDCHEVNKKVGDKSVANS